MSLYWWRITKDHIESKSKGTFGPSTADVAVTDNPANFQLADDDGEIYYDGIIYGEYDGFEPLDDFGMPAAGCTQIKLNGEWL
jgi:hypothetical protein